MKSYHSVLSIIMCALGFAALEIGCRGAYGVGKAGAGAVVVSVLLFVAAYAVHKAGKGE